MCLKKLHTSPIINIIFPYQIFNSWALVITSNRLTVFIQNNISNAINETKDKKLTQKSTLIDSCSFNHLHSQFLWITRFKSFFHCIEIYNFHLTPLCKQSKTKINWLFPLSVYPHSYSTNVHCKFGVILNKSIEKKENWNCTISYVLHQ